MSTCFVIKNAELVNTKFVCRIVSCQPDSLSLPRSRRKSVLEVNKRLSESMHFNSLADLLNLNILHQNRWEEDGEGGRIIHGPTEWYSKH